MIDLAFNFYLLLLQQLIRVILNAVVMGIVLDPPNTAVFVSMGGVPGIAPLVSIMS
jgi:hypothetical protein